MTYYTPLRDIFMRPALPSLRGPLSTATTATLCHFLPARRLTSWVTAYSIGHARASLGGFVRQSLGNMMVSFGRTFTTFGFSTDRILLKWFWNKLAVKCTNKGHEVLYGAAIKACPRMMLWTYRLAGWMRAANYLASPVMGIAIVWASYVVLRHMIEPPPYEAPPGCYPNGGPLIEIAQEEAPARSMVFACPAPLARLVQERVLLCERDPTLLQKVKSIASRWCDSTGVAGNERYAAINGAMAAALTVPINEQLVLQLAQSHAVKEQHSRISRYLSGIMHKYDPWWTKYFSIRR